jgi:hypothetical protein
MKSHWEHVNEHIENLGNMLKTHSKLHGNFMGTSWEYIETNKKIQYVHFPTLHNRKKTWAPEVHAAKPHWLQSLLLN